MPITGMDRMPGAGLARGTLFDKELNVTEIDVPNLTIRSSLILEKSGDNAYSIIWTSPSGASRNLSIPAMTAADTFTFLAQAQTLTNKILGAGTSITAGTITGITDLDMAAGNRTIFDTIAANTLTIGANNTTISIPGNLTISGTTTTVNTTTLNIADNLFYMNSDFTGSATEDSGLVIERGDNTNVAFVWDESADEFIMVTTNNTGSGNDITEIAYANLQIANLAVAQIDAFTLSGKLTAGSSEIEGSNFDIDGGTVDGITSLTVANNVDMGDYKVTAKAFEASDLTAGRITFAGSNGLLADDGDLTFSTDTLTATKIGAFTAAGAIDFDDQNMTKVDINSGTVDGITTLGLAANVDVGNYTIRANNFLADSHTATRLFFAGTDGVLSTDSDLTFSTDTLTATKIGAFEAAGAINFADQNMTNVDIDSGDISGVTISGSLTWAALQDFVTYTVRTGGLLYVDTDSASTGTGQAGAAGTLTMGVGSDLAMYHDGSHSYITNTTGDFVITTDGSGAGIILDAENDTVEIKYSGAAGANFGTGGLNIVAGDAYSIAGASVLNASTLGSGVTVSSLTDVGDLDEGSITSGFGSINIGSSTFTTTGAVSVGNLTVTGSTTYVNSTELTVVDPIINLQTASGGGAIASDTNKDVGLALHYHTGSAAKIAFLGFDDTDSKLMYVPDASISSEVVSGSIGTIKANLEGTIGAANATTIAGTTGVFTTSVDISGSAGLILENDETITNSTNGYIALSGGLTIPNDGTIGSAGDADSIAISSAGVVTMNQIPVFSAGISVTGGTIAGTLSTAAQGNVTSLSTLTALQVDFINANASTLTITDSSDTGDYFSIVTTTHGATTITTVDDDAAAANLNFVVDGAVDVDAAGAINLDSGSGIWTFEDSGTEVLRFTEGSSGDVTVKLAVNAKDLIFTDNGNAEGFRILDAAVGVKVAGTIDIGHATDTTLARASAGDVNIEGNIIYRASGTDVPVTDGGTGVSTLTDGGVLLGSGTGAITAMSVLSDGQMIVGNGATDPVAESGATLRTSIGVGTSDSPQFTGIELGHATDTTIVRSGAGAITVEGTAVLLAGDALSGTTGTFTGVVDITDATDSSDASGDTGALRTEGGVSIAKKLYVGTDLSVGGDFIVSGNTTTVDTAQLHVEDPLIVLASGNTSADTVDVGIIAKYNDGANKYRGMFWDNSVDRWKFFTGTTEDLATVTEINTVHANYTAANIEAASIYGTIATVAQPNITSVSSSFASTITSAVASSYLQLNDNAALRLGTGNDSTIYYDGTDTLWDLQAVGTGALMLALADSFPSPDGNAVHIWGGSAGSVTADANSRLVVESSTAGAHYLSILGPNTAQKGILFGEPASNARGYVIYYGSADSPADTLAFATEGNEGIRLSGGATPTLAFQGAAIISTTSSTLTLNPATTIEFNGNTVNGSGNFYTNTATGGAIFDEAASATNPTLIPNRADGNTGIGWVSDNNLSLITDGVERMRISAVGNVAIGAGASSVTRFRVAGAYTGRRLMSTGGGTLTGEAGQEIASLWIDSAVVEAASGTHAHIDQARFDGYNVATGDPGGTTTDAATIHINSAMSGATSGNYALFVDAGLSRFDSAITGEGGTGDMYLNSGSTGNAGAPTYVFTGDTDTGMFRATTNAIGFSTAGTERVRIDAAGKVVINEDEFTAAQDVGGTSALQVLGRSGGTDNAVTIGRWVNGSAGGQLHFVSSRNATIGSHTIVADNDKVGSIRWFPDDGVDYSTEAASFYAEVDDSSPEAGGVGMAFVWEQMAGGGTSAAGETMRIAANGKVGIGTGSGVDELLHVQSSGTGAYLKIETSGTYGYIGYGGNTTLNMQSVGDNALTLMTNGVERIWIKGDGDVAIGKTNPGSKLDVEGEVRIGTASSSLLQIIPDTGKTQIRLNANANTADLEFQNSSAATIMYIDESTKNVGIGQTIPTAKLHLAPASGEYGIKIEGPTHTAFARAIQITETWNNSGVGFEVLYMNITDTSSDGSAAFISLNQNGAKFNVRKDGEVYAAGDYNDISDQRIKTNVQTLPSALSKVAQMRGVSFDRLDGGASSVGLIAQELELIAPELVKVGIKNTILDDGTEIEDVKGVSYSHLVAYLIEAIKELKAEVDILKAA